MTKPTNLSGASTTTNNSYHTSDILAMYSIRIPIHNVNVA